MGNDVLPAVKYVVLVVTEETLSGKLPLAPASTAVRVITDPLTVAVTGEVLPLRITARAVAMVAEVLLVEEYPTRA